MKKQKKTSTKLTTPIKRAKTTIKENIGKVLIDVGKLIFGSIFLGGILRGEIPQAILAIGGLVIAIALLAIGILLVTKREKDGENGSPPAKKE